MGTGEQPLPERSTIMATDVPIPEWVTVGGQIIISRARSYGRDVEYITVTVERLTATLVITSDGRRISRRDVYADNHTYLNPADRSVWAKLAAQAELKTIRYLESRLDEYLRKGRHGNREDAAEARTHLIDLIKATAAQLED